MMMRSVLGVMLLLTGIAAPVLPAEEIRYKAPAEPLLELSLVADPAPSALAENLEGAIGLMQVYHKALEKNEIVGIAQEDYSQSLYQRKKVNAALYPDITLFGMYFQQEDISAGGLEGQSFLLNNRRQSQFRVEQTLFNGLKELHGLKFTQYLMEASGQNLRQTENDLFLNVAVAFYGTLKQQKEVETLEDSLRLQRERLDEIVARQKVGLARQTDVLLTETLVASDESQLVRAKNALEIARQILNFVVGEPVRADLKDDIAEPSPPQDDEAMVQYAIAKRADVQSTRWAVKAAGSNVDVIRSEYWPSLEFLGNYYTERQGIQSPVSWDFQLSLSFDLPFGRDTRARELQALSQKRQLELQEQRLERQVRLDVETAILDWKSVDALVVSLQKEFDVAEENYRLVQEEYRIGLSTNLEVLTSYQLLQNARLELEKEKINRKVAWVRLQNAIGENPGLEKME